jgi:hypothetical protein
MTTRDTHGSHMTGTFGKEKCQTASTLVDIGAFAYSRLQLTFCTAGGFHVPWPAGRIEGGLFFGQ